MDKVGRSEAVFVEPFDAAARVSVQPDAAFLLDAKIDMVGQGELGAAEPGADQLERGLEHRPGCDALEALNDIMDTDAVGHAHRDPPRCILKLPRGIALDRRAPAPALNSGAVAVDLLGRDED